MAHVDVDVWYDGGGKIMAVGRAPPGSRGRVIAIPAAGREVISVRIAEEHVAALHRTHVVDVRYKKVAAVQR